MSSETASPALDVERELAELRARVRRTPAPPADELTALQKAIANLNAWNRLGAAFRFAPPIQKAASKAA